MPDEKRYGRKWSEEETILAFYYYCQIPFSKISQNNPKIIEIANLIGRTPAALTYKMGNLGHCDPSLREQNIVGFSNGSRLDEQVVDLFVNDWEGLTYRANQIMLSYLQDNSVEGQIELPIGSDIETELTSRVNQDFFRETVLSSYSGSCCITGIAIPSLLVASHIKPWAVSNPMKERTNPRNGLCLNALHDKAFDKGFITVLPNYTIIVSQKLKELKNTSAEWLLSCDKQTITLPKRFLPAKEFLEYHNDVVFIK